MKPPIPYHFLMTSHPGLTPLTHPALCARLWQRLMLGIPEVWAAVFMLDHIHLIADARDPIEIRRLIAVEARAACRIFYPGENIWSEAPKPELLPNSLHLQRTIRYVHLNPCRDRLAADPIEWEWSTHRDALGLTGQSWIPLDRLAGLLRCHRSQLPELFHKYVSSDPSVAVAGTPAPKRLGLDAPLSATPEICARAVAAVSRSALDDVLKRGPLRDAAAVLAVQHARNSIETVGAALGIAPRTFGRVLAREVDAQILEAARFYLGDARCYRLGGRR